MTIKLTTAETLLWANNDWRDGFLVALQYAVADDVLYVNIENDSGATLVSYRRKWTAVP